MKPETLDKICALVFTATEDEVAAIQNALLNRRQHIKQSIIRTNLSTLKNGDRVRFRNVKPQYLNSTLGTVVGLKGSKFIVELDPGCDPRAVRRFGSRPVCPANILEKVES